MHFRIPEYHDLGALTFGSYTKHKSCIKNRNMTYQALLYVSQGNSVIGQNRDIDTKLRYFTEKRIRFSLH